MYSTFRLMNEVNQPLLFTSEDEVWDKVATINESAKRISPDVHWAFKELVIDLIQHRTSCKYHPLDYPIVRYFLLGDFHLVHLPYVFHPNFLTEVRKCWGDYLVKRFFCELNAENPANFYNRATSLHAVWNCAEYLAQIGGEVGDFHIQNSDANSSQDSCDVSFSFKNRPWKCEVKHLFHPDVSLYCIANVLAGMLHLKEQGKILRKYRHITLEGDSINYKFRNEVIEYIHSQINITLAKIEEDSRNCRICCSECGFAITIYPKFKKIHIVSESEPNRQIKFHLRKDQGSEPPYERYEIGPSRAYYWPQPLSQQFFEKLDEKIESIERQLRKGIGHSIGFLYLDLPVAHIDARKSSTEMQEWEQTVKNHLNKGNIPLILMTESARLQRSIYVTNRMAKQSGFDCASE